MPDIKYCTNERSQRNDRPEMSSQSGSTTPWRIHQCRGKVRALTHDLQRVNRVRGDSTQRLGPFEVSRMRSFPCGRKRSTSPDPIRGNTASRALIPNLGSDGEINRCQYCPARGGGCWWIQVGRSQRVLEGVERHDLNGAGFRTDQGTGFARVRYNPVSLVGRSGEVRRSLQSLRLVVRATAAAGTITRRSHSSGAS